MDVSHYLYIMSIMRNQNKTPRDESEVRMPAPPNGNQISRPYRQRRYPALA